MNFIVYKVTNLINGKIYIGYTTKTINWRWAEHCKVAYNQNSTDYNGIFKRAIRKYGKENFKIEEIERCKNLDELKTRECFWIKKLNSYAFDSNGWGYNSTLGGDGVHGYGTIPVVKLDIISGEIIEEYPSMTLAIVDNARGVNECCNNPLKEHSVNGYCFFRKSYIEGLSKQEIIDKVHQRYPHLVYQLDLEGNFIQLFKNAQSAAEVVNGSLGNIINCCLNKRRTAYGYQWVYQKDIETRIGKVPRERLSTNIPIVQYGLDGSKIKEWPSSLEAERNGLALGSKITSCCKGKAQSAGGFQWRYLSDNIQQLSSIKKLKIKDMQTGIIYDSIFQCAKAVGAKSDTIKRSCETNKKCKYGFFMYYEEEN